jgi:hypothetical protein
MLMLMLMLASDAADADAARAGRTSLDAVAPMLDYSQSSTLKDDLL